MDDIYLDSRRIKKGDYFISLKGKSDEGIFYLEDVVKKGGKLLYSDNFKYNYYENLKENLNKILIKHYNINFSFKIIGITGTNKKTTTGFYINKALNKYGYKSKLISTIKNDDTYYSPLTTPRNDDLIRILKQAELEKLDYLIMEVSSIGYEEKRVENIPFELGILTSLESDHLDYHKSVFSYHYSKIDFIEKCKNKVIGINKNYYNFISEILSNYLKNNQINEFLANLPQVPGREDIISINPLIIVDYAHTSSAVKYVLEKYKKLTKGRLITIIGAGGNRDKTKRKEYGKLVNIYSDISIFTIDNPRYEEPRLIVEDMIENLGKEIVILDRENAIKEGINLLNKNDTLLILGKGDEDYIEIKGIKYPFKDKEIVKKYLNK